MIGLDQTHPACSKARSSPDKMPPPSSPDNTLPADYRTWSTASVLNGHTSGRRSSDRHAPRPRTHPHPRLHAQSQSQSQSQQEPKPQPQSNAQFERRLNSKKELQGGMTGRWLKEDPKRDARKDYARALAVLQKPKVDT
ncbi:hypothetical protein PV04_05811 [Phialophora macrospora]|uniref:Uncharacterized protein n=1 Tax=Phialophora macrospora TaxID=1851006 RepID=A0A0D2FEL4_9EURO|nr:hypothetical protein PV04_05811 [Phialophora macrospora]